MRPCDSVTGTRCTRCTPPSYFSRAQTPSPGSACRGLHRDRDVLVAAEVGLAGVEDLGLPALPLGVAQVHAQQVAGEQRGLLAALPRLDLEDHVLVVVGVARQQQLAQLVRELVAARLQRRDLGPKDSSSRRARARPRGRRRPAARPWYVATIGRELRVAPAQLAWRGRVGVHRRIGQLLLQLGVLAEQFIDRLEHGLALLVAGRAETQRRRTRRAGRRRSEGYLSFLPKRFSKRATRPPVSRIFCLPV